MLKRTDQMRDGYRWNHMALVKNGIKYFDKNGVRGFLIYSINHVEITDNISAPLWEVGF